MTPSPTTRPDGSSWVLPVTLGVILCLPVFVSYYRPATGWLDVIGYPLGRDFINAWVGGRLAISGAARTLFDLAAYQTAIADLFGQPLPWHVWSYPPTALPVYAPFGALPYGAALMLWSGGLFALFATAAVAPLAPSARIAAVAALALAPATILNLVGGQNGFLTAALLLGGLLLMDRRPILAGILLGLLAFKPQLAVALPIVVLARRAWWVGVAGAVTALAMVALSVALFGGNAWRLYVDVTLPIQAQLIREFDGFWTSMTVSPLPAARMFGLSPLAAAVAHVAIAIPVGVALWWGVRRAVDPCQRAALVVAATPLITPYAMTYDLTMLAVVMLWHAAGRLPPMPSAAPLIAWVLPAAAMTAGLRSLPVAPPLLLLVFITLLRTNGAHAACATASDGGR